MLFEPHQCPAGPVLRFSYEGVVLGTSVQALVAGLAIGAGLRVDTGVITVSAVDRVCFFTAVDEVVSSLTVQSVVAWATLDRICVAAG